MNKYFKKLEYKEISRKQAYKGKRIQVDEIEYLNGEKKVHREHVKAGEAVVVLPITEDNKVIMVQEPRTPIEQVILALPAGMIEPGEQPEDAAIRELEEETGYLASNVEFMREYGLITEDVKDIIRALSVEDCFAGPEKDRDSKYEGWIFKFNPLYESTKLYIKIRIEHTDKSVCLSVHEFGKYDEVN